MFSSQARVITASRLVDSELDPAPLDPAKVVSGTPEVLHRGIYAEDDLSVGIWQHGVGVSTDVEADEIFVVLSGRATIEIEDGPTLEVGPGDIGTYPPGTRTTWTVHETLRKVYLVRS
jgi:uncharacterized cupin superfamily protein